MRINALVLLLLLLLLQPACIWKLWSKGGPPEERAYDVYGTVQSISADRVVVQTGQAVETFVLNQASIKGGDFGEGAKVHVYYKRREEGNVVTMIVEKIKSRKAYRSDQ